jgi:DNA-binding transcriptional ArsR family regulator
MEHRGDADIAAIGRLLSDQTRCTMLQSLGDGRALPAGRLGRDAGVAASTASEHLARLVDGGLLTVESHGRHRFYRLAGPDVGRLMELVAGLAPPRSVRTLTDSVRGDALRTARTCYDHLAGRLGVAVFDALVRHQVLVGHDGSFVPGSDRLSSRGSAVDYQLGEGAPALLDELGAGMEQLPLRRPAVRYCVDWSEQRHHLAGGLGALLTSRMFTLRWLERGEQSRTVHVTDAGSRGLSRVLGVEWPAAPSVGTRSI